MAWPLVLLACSPLVAGFVVFEGVGKALGFGTGFLGMVYNVLEPKVRRASTFDWPLAIISAVLVIGGLVAGCDDLGRRRRRRRSAAGARFALSSTRSSSTASTSTTSTSGRSTTSSSASARFVAVFDRAVVNDSGVNGPGSHAATASAGSLKFQQTGKLPNYALAIDPRRRRARRGRLFR